MKKLLSWKSLALLLLAVMGISVSIFLAQPSQAKSANYQRMIELGFIDEVKSPEELGLDYLQQKPPELIAGLVDNIRYTRDLAETQMTDNIAYAIPLGTDEPFAARQLRNDDGETIGQVENNRGRTLSARNLDAVGTLNPSGQSEPITRRDAVQMFTQEANNGGSFDANAGSRQTIIADASGSFLQARRIAIIDLIVRDRRNSRQYLVPNIRVDTFCRDALNSVRNRSYRRYNGNLRRI